MVSHRWDQAQPLTFYTTPYSTSWDASTLGNAEDESRPRLQGHGLDQAVFRFDGGRAIKLTVYGNQAPGTSSVVVSLYKVNDPSGVPTGQYAINPNTGQVYSNTSEVWSLGPQSPPGGANNLDALGNPLPYMVVRTGYTFKATSYVVPVLDAGAYYLEVAAAANYRNPGENITLVWSLDDGSDDPGYHDAPGPPDSQPPTNGVPANDKRQNAEVVTLATTNVVDDQGNVVITEDGLSYLSSYVDITKATYVPDGADDPTDSDSYLPNDVWYKYTPHKSGSVSVVAHASPVNPLVHVMGYKAYTSGLFKMGGAYSPQELKFDVAAGVTYYFAIGFTPNSYYDGSTFVSNQSVPNGQQVQMDLIGPRTDGPNDASPDNPNGNLAPVKPATRRASQFDFITEFSGLTGYAVRIEGLSSISIVPHGEPLASGLSQSRAGDYYSQSVQKFQAPTKTLRNAGGPQSLTVDQTFKVNEDVILTSSWRMPGKLPVYKLSAAPVSSVRINITPSSFNCEVTCTFADIPATVRRT